MKIKKHYRLFIFLLAAFISTHSTGQITTVVDGVNCTNSSCSHLYDSPGTLISSQTQTVNFTGTSQINYVATHGIQLLPGFTANSYSGAGYFHAYADLSGYDVTMDPQSGQVPEFTKLEFSIKVAPLIQSYIDNFINNVQTGTLLNPFNPEDLSVEATFTSPTNVVTKIYGFYNRDFSYDGNPSNSATRWQPITNDHIFKVRFSPNEIGIWNCSIAMKYPPLTNPIQDYTFGNISFNCVASSEKGYVQVGNNGYLKFSKTGETYFPIGAYMGWANFRDWSYDPSADATVNYVRAVRPCEYYDFMQLLQSVKDHGGNYVRLILTSYSWALEWEKLGNYYDRLPHGWELDQILQWAEQNDVYLDLAMYHSVQLMDLDLDVNHTDVHQGTWDDNPYKTVSGLLHPEDPSVFITDANVKAQYKKYLRYFASRYGYSTHVAKFELCNETSQAGTALVGSNGNCLSYHPYSKTNYVTNCYTLPSTFQFQPNTWTNSNNRTLAQELDIWHGEMAKYLSVDLAIKQLINTSYAAPVEADDHTFLNQYISSTCEHDGNDLLNTNLLRSRSVLQYKANYQNKPFMFEEQYFYPFISYDPANHIPAGPNFFGYVDVHNEIWSTAFTGVCGVTPVVWPGISTKYETQRTEQIFNDNIPLLASFFSGIDLNTLTYTPIVFPTVGSSDNDATLASSLISAPLEEYILDGGIQALGWIHLRRWYWSTADRPSTGTYDGTCNCYINYCNYLNGGVYQDFHALDPLSGVTPSMVTGQTVTIPMTNGAYTVDWYETTAQGSIFQTDGVSAVGGNLTLSIPDLKPPADLCIDCRQDIAFKVYPTSQGSFHRTAKADSTLPFDIMPNPSKGIFILVMKQYPNNPLVEIFDMLGKSIYKKYFTDLQNGQIDISNFCSGIYFVHITDGTGLNETRKIVKE